mgnify:CR=1 FL=1
MLLINDLSFKRLSTNIFSDINISASPGKIIHIKGRNGSGKTTLLKTILNILEPSNGEVFWMGKNIKKNLSNLYNSTTFIMDKKTSTREITVLENIHFWKKFSSSSMSIDQIDKLLNLLSLKDYINKKVMNLSLGEIKKLELARLIIEQKKLWILDEPFSELDKQSIEIIEETFLDHVEKRGIIIFTSHYEVEIRKIEKINLTK